MGKDLRKIKLDFEESSFDPRKVDSEHHLFLHCLWHCRLVLAQIHQNLWSCLSTGILQTSVFVLCSNPMIDN